MHMQLLYVYAHRPPQDRIFTFFDHTYIQGSTAQGGSGSFKDRKAIGEVR